VESETVRRYRYLLLAGEPSSLIALHAAALSALPSAMRGEVLRTLRVRLVAGLRLSVNDRGAIARIAVLGEKRQPGSLRHSLPEGTLEELARSVVTIASTTSLLAGYRDWDGAEPAPPPEPEPPKDHHSRWHDARINPGATWGIAYVGGLSTPKDTAGPQRGCVLQPLRPRARRSA
jgi:hypothetical protein